MEFVQFHPSYDYSDFVEGLRPKINYDGTMGFELQDGIFKKFVSRARKNYEDSQKSKETVEKELTVREAMAAFLNGCTYATWDRAQVETVIDLAGQIVTEVPVVKLDCVPDESAVCALEEFLWKLETK